MRLDFFFKFVPLSLAHHAEDLRPDGSYHLQWSGHGASLADHFEFGARDSSEEDFTDVTVIAAAASAADIKPGVVRAHRILLSASSDYFLVSCGCDILRRGC